MDYKQTLNLPKTSFPMKGNLPQMEPKILEQWERDHLYEEILSRRKGKPLFLLHDGPPYANGDIHMGHALNKILKDIIVRYQSMRFKISPYVPGWDCHGLPIEYALMKELNVTKHQVNVVEFRKKARAYAMKYVGIQREQFKRLGCQGDWENPYLTLEPGYVSAALRALGELVKKGFVYRARRPVNWCWSCETALAEAEVEYEEHASPSIYVKFKAERGLHLVIWTTTPWTLTGNVAVAVHPDLTYAVRKGKVPGEQWVMLSRLPERTLSDLGFSNDPKEIVREISGRELAGLGYEHPFGLAQGRVVLADYVSTEEGTGLVHTAPGFGAEDYLTGKEHHLPVLAPVDEQGRFIGLADPIAGWNGRQVQEANPYIVEFLSRSKGLIKAGQITHSYPHCWRCHNPIIFRATDQWFLKVDHENLRRRLLEAAEQEIRWIPPEGKERMCGMLRTRPDWCLSRQRLWGIPIPAVICQGCGEGTLDPRVIENFAGAVERDPEGSDRWFSEPVERHLPGGLTCPSCKGKNFKRGTDILDVWFDSGVSHLAVLTRREGLGRPADLYLEGSDQHRGWFQVSLITAVALGGKPPYKGVLTHGFVVDGEGRKMSKSLGNVMAPQGIVSSMGADVLRLWVASSDYREDVRLSPEILAHVAEVYRKIRNTIRYCLANVSDFQGANSSASISEEIDRWIISLLAGLVEEVTRAYEECAFHRAVKLVHEFCTVRLSNLYLDAVKDRLYTSAPDDPKRRSAQKALFQIAESLLVLMAPLVPVTAEEAWGVLKQAPGSLPESVHLAPWPDSAGLPRDAALEKTWEQLLTFRDQAMKVLEEARMKGVIREALEAQLSVTVRDEGILRFLTEHEKELTESCIVSDLRVTKGDTAGPAAVVMEAARAAGAKCQRCWMYFPTVGESREHPNLCHRCVGVLV